MEAVMKELYDEEINCGIESFWDAGFTVWIGDEVNGKRAERGFDVQELDRVEGWLRNEARKLYPTIEENIERAKIRIGCSADGDTQ